MSLFNFSAAINNLVGNTPGANVSNLVQVLNDLKTFLNGGNIDATNIADGAITEALLANALQQKLGLNDGAQIGRGKFIQATGGSRTNTAYGALSNGPDVVTGVVLPTDGLIVAAYKATWQESVIGAARAAIFIGANQLRTFDDGGAGPVLQEANHGAGVANTNTSIATWQEGLLSGTNGYTGDVTTGQTVSSRRSTTIIGGGPCYVFAAAGTYDVSVQFKASSGSVTASNRKLWVWTIAF